MRARHRAKRRGPSVVAQALGSLAFFVLSYSFYQDGLLLWALQASAWLFGAVLVILILLHILGIIEWDDAGGGLVGSVFYSVVIVVAAWPPILGLFVGLVSIAATFVRTLIDVDWPGVSTSGVVVIAAAAVAGLALQYAVVLAIREDAEAFVSRFTVLPLTFLGTHIVAAVAGFVIFPITIGAFFAAIFAIFFMPMFLSIAVMRAVANADTWSMKLACMTVTATSRLVRPEDWLGLALWTAQRGWEIFNIVARNRRLYETLVGEPIAASWMDTSWQGTINMATLVVGGVGLLGCVA